MSATRRWPATGLALVGFVAALVFTGCSAGNGESQGLSSAADAQAPAEAEAPAGGAAKEDSRPEDTTAQADPAAVPAEFRVEDREIVYTGSITVRVADVDAAATKAASIATGAGGFVGSDKRSSDSRRSQATMQLRVPAGKFGTVVDDLAGLGEQQSRDISTDDVTEEIVDLDAKIASQEASVTRTRALFAQAKTVGEIVSVEAELAKRESELARLQARKRKLDDLTALSTITATLLGPDAATPKADDDGDSGFLSGLRTGWHGFTALVTVLLTALGFLLPFALILAVPAAVTWWLVRSRRRRTVSAATGTDAS